MEGGDDAVFSALKYLDSEGVECLLTGCERGLIKIFEIF